MVSLNIIAVLGLFLSYLSTYVSPGEFVYLAFFGVAYGVLLIVNLFFILFWLMVKKRLALISLITLALGVNHLRHYFEFLPSFDADLSGSKTVKIVSQNVRLFGWYNWESNIEDRDWMMRNLELAKADIYCFQEFFHNTRPGTFETRELLKKTLGTTFLHEHYPVTVHGDQHYGIATFSKYPIASQGRIEFSQERSNVCIYSDLVVGYDTIRVYNAHLASIRFSEDDYKFLSELQNNQEDKPAPDLSEGMGILTRLGNAYIKRANQITQITEHLEGSPYPVILCGDFNDTPVSFTYGKVSGILEDSFQNGGWGIGNTYQGTFPSFRIDYIFHSPELNSDQYFRLPEEVSDHHAIGTTIYWSKDN
jgi:endonuclease/exonuclease/phosphatase family metal-dependent hydrolase